MTQSSPGCISPDLHNLTLWFYTVKVPLSNKLFIALILWLEDAAVKRQETGKEVFVIALLGLNISKKQLGTGNGLLPEVSGHGYLVTLLWV